MFIIKERYLEVPNFQNWTEGLYLVDAPCGTGKSYFVFHTLYPFAKENNKKLIVFSNRNALKRQQELQAEETDIELMIKNNVKENLFDDEENIYVGLSDLVNLRESAELKEAADAFEHYLEDYARVTHMPQSVLSDICRLSVEAAHRGMEFCFMKGFELGCRVMRSALEGELEADDYAETDEDYGLEGCAAMEEDCLADDLDDEWIF